MNKQVVQLEYKPRPWQVEAHKQRRRFSVFALHRRAGKTTLAVMELVDKALQFKLELGLFVYLSPYLKQSKVIAWAMLKKVIEPLRLTGVVDVSEGELTVVFRHNKATIRIMGGDNPDALRGVRLDGVVIDEVAQIKPEVWVDIVQPALSDRRGWAIFIGTPSGINLFSELFYKAQELPDWLARKYTVYDTQAIEADETERLRRDMSETSFAREYLCDFSAAGDDQLISLLDAELAAKREYALRDIVDAPKIMGVDPARFGDDRSVICRRQGLVCAPMLVYQGIDNMELAARVAATWSDYEPDAVFIDSGAGAGVIDRLRQLGYSPIEVPFGGKANQPNVYSNRRTEMWFEMSQWIKAGSIPKLQSLKQELATPVYWYDPQGRKVLESKDEIKKRLQGGNSPDLADALALTFAAPVRKFNPIEHYKSQQRRKDYDPYSLP